MAHHKSSETSERILQAAYRRLATDGYARLNMRDVAAEAEECHFAVYRVDDETGTIHVHFRLTGFLTRSK